MMRCLKNKVLLFPLEQAHMSRGGIAYPDSFSVGDHIDHQKFWVAAKGPEVKVELELGDHVLCPANPYDHPKLEGGARVVEDTDIIAKIAYE